MARQRYVFYLGVIITLYAISQSLFNFKEVIILDEYGGYSLLLPLMKGLPYLDFSPYKTLLGQYIQLIPAYFFKTPTAAIIAGRFIMTAINSLMIISLAVYLGKRYRREAVLLALLLLISMTTFVAYSSVFRVDILTAWFGLISFILFIEKKYLWAGIVCALSFLCSQKGIFYLAAANFSLLFYSLMFKQFKLQAQKLLTFNLSFTVIFLLYILIFWILGAPFSNIINNIFGMAYTVSTNHAFVDSYQISSKNWAMTLGENPLFYITAFLGLMNLLFIEYKSPEKQSKYLIIAFYLITLIMACIWYNQAWSYFFVLFIPFLTIVQTICFNEMYNKIALNKNQFYVTSIIISLLIFTIVAILLKVHLLFFISLSLFIIFYSLLFSDNFILKNKLLIASLAICVMVSSFYPVTVFNALMRRNQHREYYNLHLAQALMRKTDCYFSGMPYFTNHLHCPDALYWMESNTRLRLVKDNNYLNLQLSKLKKAPPKIIIYNVLFALMPNQFIDFIQNLYVPYWGNVGVYAPLITAGKYQTLAFSGRYEVYCPINNKITLNHQKYFCGRDYYFAKQALYNQSNLDLRLIYRPYISPENKKKYQKPLYQNLYLLNAR